ncbi:MAG: ATP-dependent DNA helicase RecG [Bacteriovoracaceae bacterium]|nr:ATP-dependent DNA helicase RecG [Bacteriovoracaceae bacterium]
MSSKEINWDSPLNSLISGKKSKTVDKLISSGKKSVKDLLWIFPLRTQILPKVQPFSQAHSESLFKGVGHILSFRDQPNFKSMGKGKVPLSNITATIQDKFSDGTLTLKWFNCYPSQVKSLKEHKYIYFTGSLSEFMGQFQLINPEVIDLTQSDWQKSIQDWQESDQESVKVQYPTIEGISPHHLSALFDKIPDILWENILDPLPPEILKKRELLSLGKTFQLIHGKCEISELKKNYLPQAHKRIIYEEFFSEQLKIQTRREHLKDKPGIKLKSSKWDKFKELFPYELTEGQISSLNDISKDLLKGSPMMRLIQGDVGSGKTTVALIAALTVIEEGYQAAIMCPTESLALQHYLTFKGLLPDNHPVDLLIGSQSKKEKEAVYSDLEEGKVSLVVGTHALIQESVQFKNLAIAIIDEQHKFGVDQRMRLINKGDSCHCLLMTATPIPRSLSLTQYGDLDLSVINSMPSDRKGTQTRIVTHETYQKFLSFLKTRVSMREQAYIVVPAIEDNPEQDMLNLEVVLKKYCDYFPDFKIVGLHGKMKPNEKNDAFINFREKQIDILISTSVIEVGINNPNATIMAILSPERFGLSSLHQLRGRVGRGNKPGFCFLVSDKELSATALERLRVIESSTNGFKIAEEDLRIRGEGDVFGKDQSGIKTTRILTSLIENQDTLLNAREDLEDIKVNYPQIFREYVDKASQDELLFKTV